MTHTSFKKRLWNVGAPLENVAALKAAANLTALEALTIAKRGIAPEDLGGFLAPKLKNHLPDPRIFLGMSEAATRLIKAILNKETVAIWSDYDVDGACSGAILHRFLAHHGCTVIMRIPDRIKEGYGPNIDGLRDLQADGATLVCILDSGTTAFAPLEWAHENGLDVVVVDHHAAHDTLPVAVAVVNPNRKDQAPGYGHMCAAGMTLLFVIEVNRQMRGFGFDGADIMPLVGLAALATVCDIVALTTVNRAIVATGLQVLSERAYPGVAALAQVSGIEGDINVGHCGFGLGPRINAGGRIGKSDMGVKLLTTDCPHEAQRIALELNDLNVERRAKEKLATIEAIAQLKGDFLPGVTRKLAIAIVDAHEGIVGISAARVREAYDAPAFVLALTHEGVLKGSGRSVPGFDLGAVVIAAAQSGLLVKGGGHAMAAGISILPEKLEEFRAFVDAAIAKSVYGEMGVPLEADGEISLRDLSLTAVQQLERLGPFGMGNPTPRYVIRNLVVRRVNVMKDKTTGQDAHIKLWLSYPGDKDWFAAPLWSVIGTQMGDDIQSIGENPIDVTASIKLNEWNDRISVELSIEDICLSAPEGVPLDAMVQEEVEDVVPF